MREFRMKNLESGIGNRESGIGNRESGVWGDEECRELDILKMQ
ncbi:hypothetical protein [Moorena sp. SIO3H5]|nr:hypothetical protein [Moorena sp. SIO3H5]